MDRPDKQKKGKSAKNRVSEAQATSSASSPSSRKSTVSTGDHSEDWPKEHDVELIQRIKAILPEGDQRSYENRTKHIPWENVCFGDKSPYECQGRWNHIQQRLRHFRTLSELADDALKWTEYRWYSFHGGDNQKPPDYPKEPPTSAYGFFMNKKKEQIRLQNPHMTSKQISSKAGQMFKDLNEKKKEKYGKQAKVAMKKYNKELKEYKKAHLDVKMPGRVEPPQPFTPFKLFSAYHATPAVASSAYEALNDEERLKWIDLALEQKTNYLNKLEKFELENPKLKPQLTLPILNKKERLLVKTHYPKPTKPPKNGYFLFASEFLSSASSEKKRTAEMDASWTALSDYEKDVYKQQVRAINHEYKTLLASYHSKYSNKRMDKEVVNHLPDTAGKKRKKTAESSNSSKKTKLSMGNSSSQPDTNGSYLSSSSSSDEEPKKMRRASSIKSKSGKPPKRVAPSVTDRSAVTSDEELSYSSVEESTRHNKKSLKAGSSKPKNGISPKKQTLKRPTKTSTAVCSSGDSESDTNDEDNSGSSEEESTRPNKKSLKAGSKPKNGISPKRQTLKRSTKTSTAVRSSGDSESDTSDEDSSGSSEEESIGSHKKSSIVGSSKPKNGISPKKKTSKRPTKTSTAVCSSGESESNISDEDNSGSSEEDTSGSDKKSSIAGSSKPKNGISPKEQTSAGIYPSDEPASHGSDDGSLSKNQERVATSPKPVKESSNDSSVFSINEENAGKKADDSSDTSSPSSIGF